VIRARRGAGVPAQMLNGVVALLVGRLGLPIPALRMLRVHGRRSGRLRTTPVMVLRRGGGRYLVAPRGRTDWALNLDAAGWGELIRGRHVERVGATPVSGDEQAEVVAAYVRRFGWLTGRFFALGRRPTAAQAARVAHRHPVFRLGAMMLLCLAVAGPAAAARPGFTIAPGQLPADDAAAEFQLYTSLIYARPGSQTARDIDYVLRLAQFAARPDTPPARKATISRTLRVNAWWYARRGAPDRRAIVRDPAGVLHTYWGRRGFALNPVATAGRWQDLNDDVGPVDLAAALLPFGVPHSGGGRDFLVWEYYDVPDQPGVIQPGASGMAQGRIAQLMARAYHRTGEARFSDAAVGALGAFAVPVDAGGVLSDVALGPAKRPWYVERAYPGGNRWRGAALNGFMVTLLNLHGTAPLLTSRPEPLRTGPREQRRRPRAPGAVTAGRFAAALASRGEASLQRYLPLHDTGTWSIYGLLTPGFRWRTHVADKGYHCYHVRLLGKLAVQAPFRGFDRWEARWDGYARREGVDCTRQDEPAPTTPTSGPTTPID
jgi:deazaflavin-dependent oxidoreductase (nitroreductase family)